MLKPLIYTYSFSLVPKVVSYFDQFHSLTLPQSLVTHASCNMLLATWATYSVLAKKSTKKSLNLNSKNFCLGETQNFDAFAEADSISFLGTKQLQANTNRHSHTHKHTHTHLHVHRECVCCMLSECLCECLQSIQTN